MPEHSTTAATAVSLEPLTAGLFRFPILLSIPPTLRAHPGASRMGSAAWTYISWCSTGRRKSSCIGYWPARYHGERNHQGNGNKLLLQEAGDEPKQCGHTV